jgi:beta-galactosidase
MSMGRYHKPASAMSDRSLPDQERKTPMNDNVLPPFPYGAVYFRKSNPPEEDWARDYATAAEDGMNTFRHWFLWSAIEVTPGEYDWSDYDRHLDLAAEHGIKTIVAEMITVAPEWAYHRYAHARFETSEGYRLSSHMHGSCVVGGAPGLCLDNEDYREAAADFLRALVTRYRDHPGLGGYDVWNECNHRHNVCYCPATADKFRDWLREKYGNLRTLEETWHRYSFTRWEDVRPSRVLGPYPDTLDWLQFRIDDAYRLLRWRVELIRSLDPVHPITAHGVAASLTRMAPGVADDWRAAAEVESYGYTWGSSRHGDEPWKQMHAADLVRASCRGKRFWHAEAYGGPLWMQPQVIGKPRHEGRIASPEDIRYWDLVSFLCGATGLMYLRWRPLLDGPLFGAFGPYGMDGSRTPRSEMANRIAKWVRAPAQEKLWQSRPVKGEVGIVYVPETQLFTYAQQGSTDFYARSMEGAYRGFFDVNVQADWVHVDHIDEYDFLYLPFPVMLTRETADKLRGWVDAGGTLVSEGCPGYFGDRGHVGTVQPSLGLDELFGARESYVEFTPDLLEGLTFLLGPSADLRSGIAIPSFRTHRSGGTSSRLDAPDEDASVESRVLSAHMSVPGGVTLQAYKPTTGTPVGWYEDKRVAAIDHTFGKGRTLLLGTMVGHGYGARGEDSRSPVVFESLLWWAGKTKHVSCTQPSIKARLHDGAGGTYLWVANPTREPRPVRLWVSEVWGPFSSCRSLWGAEAVVEGRTVMLNAGARDVAVIALE